MVTKKFMLAVAEAGVVTSATHTQMYGCSNSSLQTHRKGLDNDLTHPGVLDLTTQYLLGKDTWNADMFDMHPRVDLSKVEGLSHDPVTYIAVTHISTDKGDEFWDYNGSATSIPPTTLSQQRRVCSSSGGEQARMRSHLEMINAEDGSTSQSNLFVHSKMRTRGPKYFFPPIYRFPMAEGSLAHKTRILTLVSENTSNLTLYHEEGDRGLYKMFRYEPNWVVLRGKFH